MAQGHGMTILHQCEPQAAALAFTVAIAAAWSVTVCWPTFLDRHCGDYALHEATHCIVLTAVLDFSVFDWKMCFGSLHIYFCMHSFTAEPLSRKRC